MNRVKKTIPKNLKDGIPLKVRPGQTIRLEVTDEPLTVHAGLSLFYAMAEALEIPRILDERVHVKERERGYPESEHILALAAKAFIGGDYLEDLEAEALQEDIAIQKAIRRKEIPDPTNGRRLLSAVYVGAYLADESGVCGDSISGLSAT